MIVLLFYCVSHVNATNTDKGKYTLKECSGFILVVDLLLFLHVNSVDTCKLI